ncbi:MAG: penicillin-binding protein 1C [Caldithrix sp.]|nr:penicillin-binding protein 1C [Caldithrix sp.]
MIRQIKLKYQFKSFYGLYKRHKYLSRISLLLMSLVILFCIVPLPHPLFDNDYSTVVYDRDGHILRVYLNDDEQWLWPPQNEPLPHKLTQAVLHFEDRYFYWHPGVNPLSLVRAAWQNLTSGRIVSGASTVTMQVARLMQPKSRTYGHKLLEMLQAVKIECLYSKNDILTQYLNHAPYGGNIIGYRAASWRYFRKPPEQISWAEAATLAVLPNAPGLIAPQKDGAALRKKRNRLLRRLADHTVIDEETHDLAVQEPLPQAEYPFPCNAPHLADHLRVEHPGQNVFRTTIDQSLQQAVKDLADDHHQYLQTLGIPNLAVLVVDNTTGAVRAYIGSQNYFDRENKGAIDGVQALRSSGSILKPFLYALSMDAGIILPQTRIRDIPSFYHGFSPANADERYRGIVRADQALIQSLNVPAVRLLNTYGLYDFYHFLKQAGISSLFRKANAYGLPLILGGADVRLWEMAGMYRGLARNGAFEGIHCLQDENTRPKTKERPLISPGAVHLTRQILTQLKRPGSAYYWQLYGSQPLVWKTGTSYGSRDGWAIGVNPRWTIAVWTGDFDGSENANISGARCAAPLLFDIFNYLPKEQGQTKFPAPQGAFKRIDICKQTGYAAGQDCADIVRMRAPRSTRGMKRCPYHRSFFVSADSSEQVCSLCWQSGRYHKITRLIYPPAVQQFLRERGMVSTSLPLHRRSCPSLKGADVLSIIYPQPNSHLWIPKDYDGNYQKITMRAAHGQNDQQIFWYLDRQYMGRSENRHSKAFRLQKGWHELEVIDGQGRSQKVRFYANLR